MRDCFNISIGVAIGIWAMVFLIVSGRATVRCTPDEQVKVERVCDEPYTVSGCKTVVENLENAVKQD